MQEKDPGVAVILSFFWAGLGQFYNGQFGKGISFVLLQALNSVLIFLFIGFVTFPIFWIWGMVDAYKSAEKINANFDR